jgi:hypothetical protein
MCGANCAPINNDTNTVSKQTKNEFPHDPFLLGVISVASKAISEPMVRLAQIEQLSCVKISTVSKRTETRFHKTHVT